MPAWAAKLLATGERPVEADGEAYQDYIGWVFFGDSVTGLPDPMSDAGFPLWGTVYDDAEQAP